MTGFEGIQTEWSAVLAMVLIGLAQAGLLYKMAERHLSPVWLWLLLAFFVGASAHYPAFQNSSVGGLLAMLAIYGIWLHLGQVYIGDVRRRYLIGSGIATALIGWVTPVLGMLVLLSLGVFSILHCFLHEREEQGISYTQVSNRVVYARWLSMWGRYWLLSLIVTQLLVLGALLVLGQLPAALAQWAHDALFLPTPQFGYFSTFHQEFMAMMSSPDTMVFWPWRGWLFQAMGALQLILVGVLPIIGLLGAGYRIPNRFVYRLLQRPDEELLLFWLAGMAMILATFHLEVDSRSSLSIVRYGAPTFLLGFWIMAQWLRRRSKLERLTQWLLAVLFGLIMLSEATGGICYLFVPSLH